MAADEAEGLFDPEKLRVLLAHGGGAQRPRGGRHRLAHREANPLIPSRSSTSSACPALPSTFRQRSRGAPRRTTSSQHIARMRAMAVGGRRARAGHPHATRATTSPGTSARVRQGLRSRDRRRERTRRGMRGESSRSSWAKRRATWPSSSTRPVNGPYAAILVPVDGSFSARRSRVRVRYAEGAGEGARGYDRPGTERGTAAHNRARPHRRLHGPLAAGAYPRQSQQLC